MMSSPNQLVSGDEYLSKLEGLSRRFLGGGFRDARDLWRFQLDLAQMLLDIQKMEADARAELKALNSNEAEILRARRAPWKSDVKLIQIAKQELSGILDTYGSLHTVVRRLGDAFAWVVLRLDEAAISALAENDAVRRFPDGSSFLGVRAIATHLCAEGAGFPLLHDITNVLRIGDISFIKPGGAIQTVEVKTRDRVVKVSDEVVRLNTSVWGPREFLEPILVRSDGVSAEGTPVTRALPGNKRLPRQLQRMARAREIQMAETDNPIFLNDGWFVKIQATLRSKGYWEPLSALAEEARSTGYSGALLDDCIFCAAAFDETASAAPWAQNFEGFSWGDLLTHDLKTSELLHLDADEHPNAISWSPSLWHLTPNLPTHVMPFFLFPIGVENVIDMMRGKLWFVIFVNFTKIARTLKSKGFDVEIRSNRRGSDAQQLDVSFTRDLAGVGPSRVLLEGLSWFESKLMYEFASPDYLIDCVSALASSAERTNPFRGFDATVDFDAAEFDLC